MGLSRSEQAVSWWNGQQPITSIRICLNENFLFNFQTRSFVFRNRKKARWTMAYLIFYIYHFLSFFFFRNMDSVWHNLNQTVYLSYISSIYRLRFSVNFETKSVLFLESRWAKAAPCYHAFRPHCLLFNTRRIRSLFKFQTRGGVPFFEEAWKHSAQSEPNLVETCTVSRLSFPSIYRLLRGRFSLNSKRKAFFFFFFRGGSREHG